VDDNGNVIDIHRKMSIREMVEHPPPSRGPESPPRPSGAPGRQPEPVQAAPERREAVGDPESFDPDSADYKAYGWASNKTQPSLRVILRNGAECYLPYADLEPAAYPGGCEFVPSAPGRTGCVIILRLGGRGAPFVVIIEGLRLRRVWELICGHRTAWIHEAPAATRFQSDTEPVIRSITFKPVLAEAAEVGR
jgi:hypothetical protein